MRKLFFSLAALMIAATASAAEKPFLGVGAQVGNGSLVIAVPMNVSPTLRVEPFLGYGYASTTDSTSPVGDDKDWDSTMILGAGVSFLKDVGQNVELALGGRLTITRVAGGFEYKSSGSTLSGDDSFIGFGLAAVGGAEYYLSPRFALGVEAEIGLQSIEFPQDIKNFEFGTASFVTARLYFQ